MKMTSEDTQTDIMSLLVEIERMAEEIISKKQEIIDLDRKRNSNREAIRSLEKEAKSHFKGEDSKSWLAMGNSFFRLPNRNAVNMLKKDQQELDISVNKLRSDLKIDVNNLREKEGKEELKGYGLNALSKEEFKAVNSVIRANAEPTPKFYFK